MDHGTYDEHQAYCESLCALEPEYLVDLRRATYQKLLRPRMSSGLLQGRFLSMMSHSCQAKRILEIGTFSGYSALCLAEGLTDEGQLISLEVNEELAYFHQEHLFPIELAKKIKVVYGRALDTLPSMNGPFDLIYLDADKENYAQYYPIVKDLLSQHGLMLIDNMLWEGKVLCPTDEGDHQTAAIKTLTTLIIEDQDVEQVLIPMRDGLMMVRKK